MPPADPVAYVEALVRLSDDERRWLAGQFHERTLERGGHVLREGERCRELVFVAEGVLRVYLLDDGDEQTAYFGTESQFVTDYESVLSGAPSAMNVDAVTDCRLAVLPAEALTEAYGRLAEGERLGRLVAERLFLAAHRRLVSFYLDSAEARYRALVEEHPGLVQRVPQHTLASYLGVRPPSLSRIRARIAGRGPQTGGGSSPG